MYGVADRMVKAVPIRDQDKTPADDVTDMSRGKKKEKGYWVKRNERFTRGDHAQSRAGALRQHQHVSHVTLDRKGDHYEVSYSVAKFFMEELDRAGIKL